MSNEIELKLTVKPDFIHFLSQSMTNFRILKQEKIFLGNTYYDSVEQQLAYNKMGLRVRRQDESFTLTLKTDGQVKGGLHIRPEFNLPLENAEIGVDQLVKLEQMSGVNVKNFMPLQPLFSTDFERQSWLVETGNGANIEIAFDLGEIRAGDKSEPICEVEFELKQGSVRDLLFFVQGLILENDVRLSSASKAKRGYALANTHPQPKDWIHQWRSFIHNEYADPQEKLTALLQFEQNLIEETIALGADYFHGEFLSCVERIGAFFNLYHHYQEEKSLFSAVSEQSEDNASLVVDVLENNQWLLDQIKQIILVHSESKNNSLAMSKLFNLLNNGQYVKRLLNLVQLGL